MGHFVEQGECMLHGARSHNLNESPCEMRRRRRCWFLSVSEGGGVGFWGAFMGSGGVEEEAVMVMVMEGKCCTHFQHLL